MTRVVIWATHLQTDILALSSYLDACADIELLIVAPDTKAFLKEPYARVRPFTAPLLDRNDPEIFEEVKAFQADVVVADNHIPPKGTAPRLFYMWHGMGWKARSKLDLKVFYYQVQQLTGIDPREHNPYFLAQCYGPTDLAWRINDWHLPPQSCVPIGMMFADLLLAPPYDKSDLVNDYKIDILNRKTVLLSITWHYGGVFARKPSLRRTLASLFNRTSVNEEDIGFLRALAAAVGQRNANLLICLHDRRRYDDAFLAAIEGLANDHDHIEIRFKDHHPDNTTDLLVADVMISNLSSFLCYFYLLRRPAIHIRPLSEGAVEMERMVMLMSKIRFRSWYKSEKAWMLDPEDTGGPLVSTTNEAIAALLTALDNPSFGHEALESWLSRHLPVIDGKACERFKQQLDRLNAAALPRPA